MIVISVTDVFFKSSHLFSAFQLPLCSALIFIYPSPPFLILVIPFFISCATYKVGLMWAIIFWEGSLKNSYSFCDNLRWMSAVGNYGSSKPWLVNKMAEKYKERVHTLQWTLQGLGLVLLRTITAPKCLHGLTCEKEKWHWIKSENMTFMYHVSMS